MNPLPLLAPALLQATPLVLGGLGGVLSERSGVVNIALEGMMLTGAFVGLWAGQSLGLAGGVAAALFAGAALGLLHAWLTQVLRVNQIVSGLALNLLALHGTTFLLRRLFDFAAPPREPRVASTIHAWWFVLAAAFLALLVHVLLYRTPLGMRMRSVGESPEGARMAGLSPRRLRLTAVTLSGVLAAAGGAYLSLAQVGRFSDDMVSGRGYIALAAVVCGRWTPLGMAAAALFFGLFDALQIRLQGTVALPGEALRALPYAVTILVAATFRSTAPAALGAADPEDE